MVINRSPPAEQPNAVGGSLLGKFFLKKNVGGLDLLCNMCFTPRGCKLLEMIPTELCNSWSLLFTESSKDGWQRMKPVAITHDIDWQTWARGRRPKKGSGTNNISVVTWQQEICNNLLFPFLPWAFHQLHQNSIDSADISTDYNSSDSQV